MVLVFSSVPEVRSLREVSETSFQFLRRGNSSRIWRYLTYFTGPAALLLDFAIIGFMLFNVVYALGELAIMYPVSGGFYTYAARFISPSWGFAMGWNYVFQWLIVLPLELTVAGITVDYWRDRINTSVGLWITIFFLAICL